MPNQPKKIVNIYTNSYSDSSNFFSNIGHLLFRWKSSVYKLIWQDALFFAVGYGALSTIYRTVLIQYPVPREIFEIMCVYANRFSNIIPISFLTGFYVSQVVTRWWDQFMSLPWPEKVAYKLVGFVPGKDHFNKHLRLTVMRYINLSTLLSYRMVSSKVLEKFPTYKSLIDAKMMLPHEVSRLKRAETFMPNEVSSVPIVWAVKLIQKAKDEGRIEMDPPVFASMINAFDYVQECNRKMLNYGWMNFPLAYTQVATLSVLIYFLAAMFGRQYLIPTADQMDTTTFPNINITYSSQEPFKAHSPDFYIPYFTFVELLCYMGWIKVADALLNPFGDDDQDFQVNYLIERNIKVSYLIVDQANDELETENVFLETGIDIATYNDSISSRISIVNPFAISENAYDEKDSTILSRMKDSFMCRSNPNDVTPIGISNRHNTGAYVNKSMGDASE